MIRRPPRSTLSSSSAASDVYKRQIFNRTCQIVIGHLFYGRSQEDTRLGYANLVADVHGDQVAVAGQDLDVDAIGMKCRDGFPCCGFGRVQERKKAQQGKVMFVFYRVDAV